MESTREIGSEELFEIVRAAMLDAVEEDERSRASVLQMSLDTPLESLGIDSMAAMEIAAYIEDELDILLPEDGFEDTASVRDLVGFVRAHLTPS